MSKKVTIKDIADKANVSKSTVSKALGCATDINELTRERVLYCASELGYEIKKYKAQTKGNLITFVEGIDYDNVNQFGYDLILGFQIAASDAQYGVNVVSIKNTDKLNSKYEDIMKKGEYCGSFILGFKPDDYFLASIKDAGIPAVVLDNDYDSEFVARVGSDNKVGIGMVVKHLYNLGHKKIAFFGGDEDSNVTRERKNAFIESLNNNGLEFEEKLIAYSGFYTDTAPKELMSIVNEGITAIVCASDIIAINTINELSRNGINVPKDISVTGYDDIPLAKYSNPSLTTVFQNRVHIGRSAFYVLCQLMNGVKINNMILRPELIKRNSTAPIKMNG